MYKEYITEVPNFPIKGVNFKDISPLLADQETFRSAIVEMGKLVGLGIHYDGKPPDYWIGIDARGFIFASAFAIHFGGGVIMCRKKGKLPPPTKSCFYQLEYATATLEMKEGSGKVVIVDDVLATGGTLRSTNLLAEKSGYDVIGNLVLMDLQYVPLVDNFDIDVSSLVTYE